MKHAIIVLVSGAIVFCSGCVKSDEQKRIADLQAQLSRDEAIILADDRLLLSNAVEIQNIAGEAKTNSENIVYISGRSIAVDSNLNNLYSNLNDRVFVLEMWKDTRQAAAAGN